MVMVKRRGDRAVDSKYFAVVLLLASSIVGMICETQTHSSLVRKYISVFHR